MHAGFQIASKGIVMQGQGCEVCQKAQRRRHGTNKVISTQFQYFEGQEFRQEYIVRERPNKGIELHIQTCQVRWECAREFASQGIVIQIKSLKRSQKRKSGGQCSGKRILVDFQRLCIDVESVRIIQPTPQQGRTGIQQNTTHT